VAVDSPGFTFFDFYREAKENTEYTSQVVTCLIATVGPKSISPGKMTIQGRFSASSSTSPWK